jgi:hypothetical protein
MAQRIERNGTVLAYNIIDVEHIPGSTNIADRLSRQFEGHAKENGDGSEWTVDPAWELTAGLPQEAFNVTVSEENGTLLEHFKDEPLYQDMIEALLSLQQSNTSLQEQKKAQHRALQYMIEEGKLWRIGGGTKMRA